MCAQVEGESSLRENVSGSRNAIPALKARAMFYFLSDSWRARAGFAGRLSQKEEKRDSLLPHAPLAK